MDVRKKLILKGIKLFAEYSFDSVSIDMIVKKAKVSKGAFYHYFSSKIGFYNEILSWGFDRFNELLIENKTKNLLNDKPLHIIIKTSLQFSQKYKMLSYLIQKELAKLSIGKRSLLYTYQQKFHDLVASKIAQQNDDKLFIYIFLGILRGASMYLAQNETNFDDLLKKVEDYVDACESIYLKSMKVGKNI